MKHYLLSAAAFAFLAFSCTYEGLATNNDDAPENSAPSVASHAAGTGVNNDDNNTKLAESLAKLLAGAPEEKRAEFFADIQRTHKQHLERLNSTLYCNKK